MGSIERFKGKYNITNLIEVLPELKPKIISNKFGDPTINFSDSESIMLLNKALLKYHYGIKNWNIPLNYLIPPIPGRADYVGGVVDLIKSECEHTSVNFSKLKGLDIGCGASCIYPIIFTSEFGGQMIASDIDEIAIKTAREIVAANPSLSHKVEIIHQKNRNHFFSGIIKKDEQIEFSMCNPPFYSSVEEASKENARKEKKLKTGKKKRNFNGRQNELIYEGGEKSFVKQMIKDSANFSKAVLWFTVLVSREDNLKLYKNLLSTEEIKEFRIIEMSRGNKMSRFIAWSYYTKKQRISWLNYRLKAE